MVNKEKEKERKKCYKCGKLLPEVYNVFKLNLMCFDCYIKENSNLDEVFDFE